MGDVREAFAGDVERIGRSVITRRNHDGACVVLAPARHPEHKSLPLLHGGEEGVVERGVKRILVGDASVIIDAMERRGTRGGDHDGNAADLEQFWSRKEIHLALVALDAVDDAALIGDEVAHPRVPGFYRACESGRTCPDDEKVVCVWVAHKKTSCRL